MDLSPETPVRFIPRVGPTIADRLERLGILTVGDLLYHIPFRYDDFSLVSPIARVQPGETVTINGTVEKFNAFATKSGKRLQEAKMSDDSGSISVIWFNQPYLRNVIKPGMKLHLSGSVSWFVKKIVMNSPQYEIISDESGMSLHTGRLVPVYHETEGISSKWLRGRIAFLLTELDSFLVDPLPADIRTRHHLADLGEALRTVHFPEESDAVSRARRRLGFDELFLLQLVAYMRKRERMKTAKADAFHLHEADTASLIGTLPFKLTGDQKTALSEILADLSRPVPMNRLLEGDVGSGKTIVAAIAMYEAVRNGRQAVLLAPTQILAQQHFATIQTLLGSSDLSISLITGATKVKKPADITIGTHALLSETVSFTDLGLIVIDEQHRFGVKQREQLTRDAADGKSPHLLTMTATPIPRTLAKTVFGNIDLSTLREMPKGRQKVKTWVVTDAKRQAAYHWITKQLGDTAAQAFIICPLIEDSDALSDVKAVKSEYERLNGIFPKLSLGLLHGKLKPDEKTKVLTAFRNKEYDILVATPVVEVGIDIPNATIMVIEASERFGLGQLHQLRGRVGRGALASYCLLFSSVSDPSSVARLKAMEMTYDGAELAEIDLALRGPGDIFGSRQHGESFMKVASYLDKSGVTESFEAVRSVTNRDPDLANLPYLRELIKKSKIETIVQD